MPDCIEKNKVVTIDYTLTDSAGEVLDTSKGAEPLAYLHGQNNIVPGLERALDGKSQGESLKVSVAPGDGYGQKDERLVQSVLKKMFGNQNVTVGMRFQARGQQDGPPQVVTVTRVEGDNVTIDANHPLAGQTLNFDITVVGVRDATKEELDHGHVHGPGGHHH